MKVAKKFGIMLASLFFFITTGMLAEDNLAREIESGRTLMKAGEFQKSAELLNKLLTQNKDEIKDHPRHAEAWYLFSVSLRKLERTDLADKALERAKKLRELAQTTKPPQIDESKTSESDFIEPTSEVTADKNPASATTTDIQPASEPENNVYNLASLKNEKARKHYRNGMVQLETGQAQTAADEFLAAVEAEPGNIELLTKTAETLEQIGSSYYQKAMRVFAELETANPGKQTVKQQAAYARASIFAGKPDLAKAESIITALLKNEPENVELLILAAQLDTENKKFQPAVNTYEKIIKLDTGNMPAYLGLGDVYQHMKQFPKAIEVLQKARGMWPDSVLPLVSLGKAYLENDNKGFALVMFNLAYEMNPDSFDVNLGLLEILAQGADYRANKHLAKCESIVIGDPRVEFWKAVFLEFDEYPAKAMLIYSRLALYKDDIAYKAKLRLGQLYSGKGHESFPGNLLVRDRPRFSRVYRAMINQEFAYSYFQDFLAKMPDSPEAPEVKRWIYENEEGVRRAREFEALIQSQLKTN
ncbi:MAG: tetratricopeptide repeat protein [Candidatus Riflebacteria bacterium]|nr:tetratricopeptide repeat protein [Candidatus Riflebacteria bacterium]